ncbi:MAG: hypothetical protein IJU23_08305 [Proteobacteria bacterium]|nr:hypothetical protein [Pseudomonadota bacterium]
MALLITGCESESDEFAFSIYANPARTHAPGNVHFELMRDDGLDVDVCTGNWNFGDGISLSGDYEAEHRYRDAGTYNVEVDLNCSGQKAHASTQIEVFGTVDLSLGALEARPLDISTDGNISVSLQVANNADTALQVPTYIDIYLTPTASVSAYLEAGANRLYRYSLQSLPGHGNGESVKKIDIDVPMDASVRTGTYYITAVVNADKLVGESSYDNNVAFSTQALTVRNQSTDGADFVATRLQVSPSVTSTLTAATAQFDIINQGSTTAETFQYEIWISEKDNAVNMDNAVKIHESTIDGGMSGVEQNIKNVLLSVAPAITEPGFYYFWLVLDSTNVIVERDENNNTIRSAAPIQVTDDPVLDADITITKLTFAPSSANPGGTFSVTLDLFNQGAQPTGSFICSVFLSNDMSLDIDKDFIVGSINVDNLSKNGTGKYTAVMEADTGIAPGKYWVYAFCDSSGVIGEANEDNNIQRGEQQLVITSSTDVDLVFGAPQIESSPNLVDGDELALSIMMCNKGSTSAGPAYVSAIRTNQCDYSEKEFGRILVPGLEAGKCQSVYFKSPMICDFWCPNYTFRFVADSTLIVDEKDEANNQKTLSQTISMSGDSCVCAGDKYEINNAVSASSPVNQIDAPLTLCKNDEDYYHLEMEDGQSFEVKLEYDETISPLKMELIRGSDVVKSYTGGNTLYLSGINIQNTAELPVYIHVSGAEKGNANRYHLNLDIYETNSGIDLAASDLVIDGDALDASDYKTVTMTIANIGKEASGNFSIGYYLSQTSEIDDSAWRITKINGDSLAPGETRTQTVSLKLPADTSGGHYHLIARMDDDNAINDVRKSNNIARTSQWKFERSCWDVLDPNEEFESAREITFNAGSFHYDELAVCRNNKDIYKFDVKHGTQIDIKAIGDGKADYDIVLYDQNHNEIAASRTGNAEESIHKDIIVGDQKLYLEVFLLDNKYNGNELAYSLDIQLKDAPSWYACKPVFEPNNFPSSAWDLLNAARSGQEAELCPEKDEDFYAIEMKQGDRFQLGISTTSSGIRAALYRGEDLNFVSMLTNLGSQVFDYTATEDNIYYLKIYTNVSNPSTMAYTLNWYGTSDTDIAISGLKLSEEKLWAGGTMTIEYDIMNKGVGETDYDSEISLLSTNKYILTTHSGHLAENETIHVREKLDIPASVSGKMLLTASVHTDNDTTTGNNSASINIDVAPSCQNDGAENNNNILLATTLEDNAEGTICPGDQDWFKVTTTEKRDITLAFLHSKGDLDLILYDSTGIEIARSATAADEESVTIETAGTYYLLVQGSHSDVSNTYSLTVK